MKQNLHINYENYINWFLLYVDGELSEIEKQQVLQFVADNPRLRPEMEALLGTINTPDETVLFSKKEDLFKTSTPEEITDEQLILFLDDELDENDAAAIKRDESDALQSRLQQLKNAYSDPDPSIEFAKKESLYKSDRTIAIYRWLPRVAAVVVALAIGYWMFDAYRAGQDPQKGVTGSEIGLRENTPDSQRISDTSPADSVFPGKKQVQVEKENDEEDEQGVDLPKRNRKPVTQAIKTVEIRSSVEPGAPLPYDNKVNRVQEVTGNTGDLTKEKETAVAQLEKETAVQSVQIEKADVVVVNKSSEPKRKALFNRVAEKFKERALEVLSDDNENINVAGFAINVRN